MTTLTNTLPRHQISDSTGIIAAIETDGAAFIPGAISQELAEETCRRIMI